ncbi:zinc finger translocation-associated protein isoform X2 [Synchiropus splendidus]|uniref:zinc finger translocation-associated protein isoform X2 n=1 Tax=Synchiropus splendidus TaxID=270530 RepID=UPI00237E075A|nr:zinc finger translocation-associated protein isoform X2 [Synchiropus splendidus]
MEETDIEPVDLRRAEHTELLSFMIGGEEEPTQEESDHAEEEGLANGHGEDGSEGPRITPRPTSYWSITEGPDQPLLLSPAPGPSRLKSRVHRASRPGLSRIPGRDHRRYYHEYWRSEYLMDFDPQRHGMICMVCGSSLATLKLSTIKRHIRQKHPDSLLWSPADKEVIRSGWESHLSLGGAQRQYGSPDAAPTSPERQDEFLEAGQHSADILDAAHQEDQPQQRLSASPHSEASDAPQPPAEPQDLSTPTAKTLERYLNDSLHAWFRQEFLMEYEVEASRLLCMVCGDQLPSLHLDHIKSHVLDNHPDSLVYSSEEKHCVLQAWAQTHDTANSVKSDPDAKDSSVEIFSQEVEALHTNTDSYPTTEDTFTQDTCLIGEDGGVGAPPLAPVSFRQPRRRRLRGGNPWRLRLDYMVAYGPPSRGTFCMVCSQVLPQTKVSSFRRHIQECHPDTTTLSRQEREAMAAAWTKDYSTEDTSLNQEEISAAAVLNSTGDTNEDDSSESAAVKREEGAGGGRGRPRDTPSRHSHYPGKDQRRNYQVRWRMEYLMEYDSQRHGLLCMVCGAALVTLKVSTIKRHIQQVHPHSLSYSDELKQQVINTAPQFFHNKGLSEMQPAAANDGT